MTLSLNATKPGIGECRSRVIRRSDPGSAAEELENTSAALVRLGEHGRTGLHQDLVLRELRHLLCHVEVTDRALRGREVLHGRLDVLRRGLDTALERADRAEGGVDVADRDVNL